MYVTISPVSTETGSFLCLYVAVVPLVNEDVSASGVLFILAIVFSVPLLFVTLVINFLKAKSNTGGGGVMLYDSSLFLSTVSIIATGCPLLAQ